MMLQALHELAKRENLLGDPDFEWKPVAWLVRVDSSGRLLGIQGTHTEREASGRKKSVRVAKNFLVPRQPVRARGAKSFFLVDKAEYVFGIDPSGKRPDCELDLRHDLFRAGVRACAEATGDEGVQAVARLLDDIESGRQAVTLPEECATNDLIAFVYAPDLDRMVSEREPVRQFWKGLRTIDVGKGSDQRCLITGKPGQTGGLHVQLKRLPGANPSGVPLVSFNEGAFESFGWSGNDNAPVSRNAAESYGTALNRLLHPAWPDPDQPGLTLPRQNIQLSSDTVVCYWASEPHEFVTLFDDVMEADPEAVRKLYRSVELGRPPEEVDSAAFYALTLTGTQGRAIVRDWFESTIAEVQANLTKHFGDLDLVRNTPKPKSRDLPPHLQLRNLVRSLAVHGEDKRLPAALAAHVMRAALAGTPYPFGLLQRAVERTRAEMGRGDWLDLERRDGRAMLIKAVLNRRRRFSPEAQKRYREVTRDMDPHNTNKGYLLGRLMAVIERIQREALGDVNATVVDKYFSGASAAPRSAFQHLLRNARHHLRKIRDKEFVGRSNPKRTLELLLDDIFWYFAPQNGGLPAFLSQEDQGLFIIGYHHMRKWLWMKKEDRERWEKEHGIDTPVDAGDLEDSGN